MKEKTAETASGTIHYWTNDILPNRMTFIFLPGLTADHHLFDQQTEAFKQEYNLLAWDAPGHAASRPFRLDFSLMDKAVWLHEILEKEGVSRPVLIGPITYFTLTYSVGKVSYNNKNTEEEHTIYSDDFPFSSNNLEMVQRDT